MEALCIEICRVLFYLDGPKPVRCDTGKISNLKRIIKKLLVKMHKIQIAIGENM